MLCQVFVVLAEIASALPGIAIPQHVEPHRSIMLSGQPVYAPPVLIGCQEALRAALAVAIAHNDEVAVIGICSTNAIRRGIVTALEPKANVAMARLLHGFTDAFDFWTIRPVFEFPHSVHYVLVVAESVTLTSENEYARFLHANMWRVLPQLHNICPYFSNKYFSPACALQRHGYADAASSLLVAGIRTTDASMGAKILQKNIRRGIYPLFACDRDVVEHLGTTVVASHLLEVLCAPDMDIDTAAILAAIRKLVGLPFVSNINEPIPSSYISTAEITAVNLALHGLAHLGALLCALLPIERPETIFANIDLNECAIECAMDMCVAIAPYRTVRRALFRNPATILIAASHVDPVVLASYSRFVPYSDEPSTW